MATKSKRTVKRTFYEVKAPLTATKVFLYSTSPQDLDGKTVILDLTRSLRGRSLELRFRVVAKGDELYGEPINVSLAGSYIRRMMRKGTDYVEDSFLAECKDAKVIIKPFMITRKKVSRAIRKRLRDGAKQFLTSHIANRNAYDVFSEIMTNRVQRELFLRLKKIYPLALCEIRVFEVTGEKKQELAKK